MWQMAGKPCTLKRRIKAPGQTPHPLHSQESRKINGNSHSCGHSGLRRTAAVQYYRTVGGCSTVCYKVFDCSSHTVPGFTNPVHKGCSTHPIIPLEVFPSHFCILFFIVSMRCSMPSQELVHLQQQSIAGLRGRTWDLM